MKLSGPDEFLWAFGDAKCIECSGVSSNGFAGLRNGAKCDARLES